MTRYAWAIVALLFSGLFIAGCGGGPIFAPPAGLTDGAQQPAKMLAKASPVVHGGPIAGQITKPFALLGPPNCIGLPVTPTNPGGCPGSQSAVNRSDFIHTDSIMRHTAGIIPGGVLDLAHQHMFITDANFNRVQVISTVSKSVIKNIPIPLPWGLDLSVDGTRVLVGTGTRQLFLIDTTQLQVVEQHTLPFGLPDELNLFYTTSVPAQMANGKILIVSQDPNTTFSAFLEWDLNSNTVTLPISDPAFSAGYMVKSANGAKAVVGADTSPSKIELYDSATDSFTITLDIPGTSAPLAVNRNGTQIILSENGIGVGVYDGNLNLLYMLPSGPLGGSSFLGAVFSPDGSKIHYTFNVDGIFTLMPNVVTVNAPSGSLLGVAPAIPLLTPGITRAPPFLVGTPLAADDTGLIYSATDHGIAVEDAAFFQPFVAGMVTPEFGKLLTPNVTAVNSSVNVAFPQLFMNVPLDIWFGRQRASNVALAGGVITADSPQSAQPGAVNVKLLAPDGTLAFYASGFMYGPQIMYPAFSAGASAGGATAHIIGLGLPSDPSKIGVTLGNQSATVVSSTAVHYGPFPTQDVQITLPAGASGIADLKLTTPAGSVTVPNAFHFVNVQDFTETGDLQAVLYDRFRNQVYVSAGDHVDVFSPVLKTFGAPLPMPAASGVAKAGPLALTPDGKKLLVGNFGDGSLAIIDPDNPANRQAVNLFHAGIFPNCVIGPRSIAPTNSGTVVIRIDATPDFPLCLGDGIDVLNLTTLQSTAPALPPFCGGGGANDVFADSAGDKVIVAGSAYCTYSPATDTWAIGAGLTNTDLTNRPLARTAIAGDGNVSIWDDVSVNSKGEPVGMLALPDVFYSNDLPFSANLFDLDRRKLNDSGSLLYVLYSPSFVDVFDVRHGQPQLRVALKELLKSHAWDNLTINTAGDQIFVITDAGLTMIQLDAVPVAIGSVTPSAGPVGTTVQVRGSGFLPTSTVTFNGSSATVTFVDSSTLSVVVPAISAGSAQITIKSGATAPYSLDNGFIVQ